MVDVSRQVSLLQAKREDLLKQLGAVDRALAALEGAGSAAANPDAWNPRDEAAAEETASPVVPTRVKPQRVLSDDHKQALTEGRRKARHAKAAAAGLAREMPDPSPGPARASSEARRLPRLVKRRGPLVGESRCSHHPPADD